MNEWISSLIHLLTIEQIGHADSFLLKQVSPGLCTHLEVSPPFVSWEEAGMDLLEPGSI